MTTQAQASSIAFCSEACWTLLCTTHKLWAAASFAEWSSPGNNGCRPIGSHRQGGGEACFFRIHSNGIKNEHWPEFDQTVFLADSTVASRVFACSATRRASDAELGRCDDHHFRTVLVDRKDHKQARMGSAEVPRKRVRVESRPSMRSTPKMMRR